MLRLIAATVLVGYLPGALIFRLPFGARPARAALTAEERVFWSLLISVVWSVSLALALAAAGLYQLDRLLWISAGLSVLIAVAFRGRLRYRGDAVGRPSHPLPPLALIVLGAWLFSPPFEYVMGGKDPGTYINEGVQIAKTGSLFITDATVAAVPEASRPLFFRPPTEDVPHSVRFMGFYLLDPGSGRVVGQFPHWFAVSVAMGYDLAGVDGALATVSVWGVLGLLAVYFAGARLFGPLAASIGTGLLAVNVIEGWFGRYPNAELASQAMLFGALLAFRRALDGSTLFFGALAGVLVGLQLFSRFDALLTVGAFGAAALLASVTRERVGWPFIVSVFVTAAVGVWYLAVPMYPYSRNYLGTAANMGGWWVVVGALLAAAAFSRAMRQDGLRALTERWLPRALAASLVGLAVYAYFFREPGGRLAIQDAHAFRNFSWYMTPVGLLIAVAGFAIVMVRRFWRDPAFFVTVSLYAMFMFYKPRIFPEHFWAGRRFLTVILPAAMLSIAALAVWVFSADRMGRILGRSRSTPEAPPFGVRLAAGLLAIAAVVPLGLVFWRQAAPIRVHQEYAGLRRELDALLATVGPRDLLLVESRQADSDVHVLALPLAYLHDRPVLVFESAEPDKRALETFVSGARRRYANVYFLGGGGTDLLTRDLAADVVARRHIRVPEYASTYNAYPTGVRQKEFALSVFRLVPATARTPGPVDLLIGLDDDLNVGRFYAKERRGDGTTFRWSKNRAFVMLPGVGADAREVTIWMSSGGRAATARPATVRVRVADQLIGTVTLDDELKAYAFPIPPEVATRVASIGDPLRIQLDVPAWNPRRDLGLPDTRDLGVLVTRVRVQ